MNDFKVKYLATYQGPSYGGWHVFENMEAFDSIDAAKRSMRNRQEGDTRVVSFKENGDQMHVYDTDSYRDFPATTPMDTMVLYQVAEGPFGSLERFEDPTYRLSIGNRGGIIVQPY